MSALPVGRPARAICTRVSAPRVLKGHVAAERVPERSPLLKIQVLARFLASAVRFPMSFPCRGDTQDAALITAPIPLRSARKPAGHGEAGSDGSASIRDLRFRGVAEYGTRAAAGSTVPPTAGACAARESPAGAV